jgi:predicted nuclease of predicted toxin-antitoxin system
VKLKLDENIDARLARILRGAGHDAVTDREQDLHGTDDIDLYQVCISENRALVTLDLDFSNILRYTPEGTQGLVVLRGPDDLFVTTRILVETLIEALNKEDPLNQLWIVEPGRVRIHERA